MTINLNLCLKVVAWIAFSFGLAGDSTTTLLVAIFLMLVAK